MPEAGSSAGLQVTARITDSLFETQMQRRQKDIEADSQPGRQETRKLNLLALGVTAAGECVFLAASLAFLASGRVTLGVFLVGLIVFTASILAIVLVSRLLVKNIWLRALAERSEMERRLRESQERYKTLFESSADGIVYTDNGGAILECNRAFADMVGYKPDELKGKTYHELTPAEWHQVDSDIIESQLSNIGYSDEYMKEFLEKGGGRVPVSVRAWLAYDRGGKPTGAWAMVRDMSERIQYENFMRETIVRLEQANDRLRELDRLKTELVAVVSHELRAPLGAIESSLNAMRSIQVGSSSSEEREELIRILDRGVQRLSHLVDDLMDITRIESGQLKLETETVDALELAERVVKSFELAFQNKGLRLLLAGSDGRCDVKLDPRRIEQVLTNLVDNALKFTNSGQVVVGVERVPEGVVFSVADSGPGIPTELHQKIFEKFFSLDLSSRSGKQGVGLGLALCKGIVEAHRGRIWVESRKGEGTTFSFLIPGDHS